MSSRNILKHTANTFSPGDPSLGDEWYDTSNSRLYKYLAVNGTSPQWVELYSASSNGGLTLPSWNNSTRPVNPKTQILGYNNTTNLLDFFFPTLTGPTTLITGGAINFTSGHSLSYSLANYAVGTGDFTIEMWVWMDPASSSLCGFAASVSSAVAGIIFSRDVTGFASANGVSGTTIAWSSMGGLPTSIWMHLAMSFISGTLRIFYNGTSVGTPISNVISVTNTTIRLGHRYTDLTDWPFVGYITNFRFVSKGVYTGSFTAPTGPLLSTQSANPYGGSNTTAVTAGQTLLLLSVKNSSTKATDSSGYSPTITDGGANTFSTNVGLPISGNSTSVYDTKWATIQKRPTAFEYLIVGGGAGGGAGFSTNARGGGGGAGGVVYGNFQNYLTGSSTFTVIVGGGGAGLAANTAGVGGPGTNTSISGPTSTTTSLAALLTDRSTNAFTVTNNGGVSVVSTSTYGNYSGSLSFNGTTQYLTTPVATNGPLDLAAGAGDWTVECWVYATSLAGSASIFWKAAGENPTYALWLNLTVPQWIVSDGAAGVSSGGPPSIGLAQNLSAITTFTWYHFALVRSGSIITAYTNGVAATPQTLTFTMGNGSDGQLLYVGNANDNRFFPGYISNLRIVKGVAVYTANFTIPIAPLAVTQPASGNINAISAGQTSLLLGVNNNYLSVTGAGGGGGSSWDVRLGGISGGSGGGGYTASPAISNISTSTQRSIYGYGLGNPGSTGSVYSAVSGAGGGGGAGGAAISGLATGKGGDGGIGTNLYSSILESVSVGVRSTGGVFVSTVSNVTLYGPAAGSLFFNGPSSNSVGIRAHPTAFNFGTGNFTMELWLFPLTYVSNALTASETIDFFSNASGSYIIGQFQIQISSTGLIQFVYATTVSAATTLSSTGSIPLRAWTHVAVVREGTGANQTKIYINGRNDSSFTVSATVGSTGGGSIGRQTATNNYVFNGYITNVRIVKGSAVYTSTFDPKVNIPLSNTTNTQLLLLVTGETNKVSDSSTITNITTSNSVTFFSNFIPSTSTNVSVFSGAGNYYIAGGGGGGGSAVPGFGGIGGGGDGANITPNGYNGTVYTGGGGGGGGGASSAGGNGGSGGSGVVVIRHLDAYTTGTISTGSARVVVSGGYRNYVFTSSGVISF